MALKVPVPGVMLYVPAPEPEPAVPEYAVAVVVYAAAPLKTEEVSLFT